MFEKKRRKTSLKRRGPSRRAALFFFCVWAALFAAFAHVGAAQSVESLAAAIADGGKEQKRNALVAIRNLRTAEASRAALPALRDADETVRAEAAFSVVFLPAGEAFAALLPNLKDRSEFVRRETAYALGRTGYPPAVAPLVATLRADKILEVRNAAVVALGEIGDASALGALLEVLGQRSKEENEFSRRAAARAVGQIAQFTQTGDRRVLTPESFLPERFKIEAARNYRNLAAREPAYGAAVPVLIGVLQNAKEPADVRREAAFALGAIADPRAADALRRSVADEDYYLAEIAREALLKIESVPAG